MTAPPTAYFCSGDALRSRSVAAAVWHSVVEVPAPPQRLQADWQRETTAHLDLQPGDVEALPLARARMRWPDYPRCVQAAAAWTRTLGLGEVLAHSSVALMASRGADFHHDGLQYGGMAFCNLFLSEDQGLEVYFPVSGQRIPLLRGTVLLFDTCQPHALLARGRSAFDAADFPAGPAHTQTFLTWELDLQAPGVAAALGIALDVDPPGAARLREPQVWVQGGRAEVCPATGRWRG